MKIRQVALSLLVVALVGATGTATARVSAISPGASYGNLAWFLTAFELGPWEEYLIHELTPDLDRLTEAPTPAVSWISFDEAILLPDFAVGLLKPVVNRPTLSLARRSIISQNGSALALSADWQQLERTVMMPGISSRVSERSVATVSAVLATQRFVAAGMNLSESDVGPSSWNPLVDLRGQEDVTYGAGFRFALNHEPVAGVMLEAAFQTRIGMSEMASVKGVHGSRAELDIPSRMQLGMQVRTGSRASINLGVEQIFYSEVGAFPSRSLPARFNALLGDSTSPQFGWEDLIVYNLGWTWRHESSFELSVDYRTRSQPRPSAPALASALAPELAQNAFLIGLSKDLSERSRLQLNAAYAPPEFAFGGNVLGVLADRLDQSFEVQALWRHQF